MPHVNVNGLKMYYEVHGKGYPLVLVAGYTCDVNLWALVLDSLSSHYQVIVFDNRGVGQTDSPEEPYTIEMMADDTIELTRELGIDRFHTLGHSMGGCIAQRIAAMFPESVDKVIIANSSSFFNVTTRMNFRFFTRLRELKVDLKLLVEGILPWLYSPEFLTTPENVKLIVQLATHNPRPQTVEGQKNQMNALLTFDARPWLESIKAKTLVICGEKDITSPPSDAAFSAEHIANSQLLTIPGVAHLPLIEAPQLFVDAVLKFLA
ncbi:MAG: alpha/beta hydrolase [Chlamydiales bacterium]|nr:alpha/beta hydrolase [Chlamydiales bacterium]